MLLRLHDKRLLRWLGVLVSTLVLLGLLDICFPLALHKGSPQSFATVVFDRDGKPLRAFPDAAGVWRYGISLDEVSPLYLEALLTYEDQRFWWHPGVDPLALLRAAYLNVTQQKIVSGGSTISMQVARLLHPHSRTLPGKVYQIFRTLQLEWHLSKREILTLYCNIAPFGGTIEGVQAASYTYLNKPSNQLTHAEAALLAVLPQSPTRYRPDLHPDVALQARNKVLKRMVSLHVWSEETVNAARLERVFGIRHTPEQQAPLLARRLLRQGLSDGSQRIKTTLDGELQRSLQDYVSYYAGQQPQKTSAAVLVVENSTTNVLAYVGTAEFGNSARFGHVDMVTAVRSPGSTLKPFLYALALDSGLVHSHSLLSDAPKNWQDYRPGNFNGGFSGPVSVSEALQRSLNIPAVQLFDHFGPKNFSARIKNAGIALHVPNEEANLSIILGGAGLTLESLVKGYMAFGNGGKTFDLRYTQQQQKSPARFLFSEQAAWVTQNILAGVSRPNSVKTLSAMQPRDKLAWKTGTSYGFRDSWAVGVDRKYTIGVWVGRPDGTALPGNTGRLSAGPLLHAIADYLPDSRVPIVQPEGITKSAICWPLGTAKNQTLEAQCHRALDAWVINGMIPPSLPAENSSEANPFSFWVDENRQKRVHAHCDFPLSKAQRKTVALWPAALEPWIPYKYRRAQQIPGYANSCHRTIEGAAKLFITGIETGTHYRAAVNQQVSPRVDLVAAGGEGTQYWFINGQYHHSARPLSKRAVELSLKGENQILVMDDAGNTDMVKIILE